MPSTPPDGETAERPPRQQDACAQREADAHKRHQLHVAPETTRLDRQIDMCRNAVEQAEARQEHYRHAEPAVADLASLSARNASRLSAHLAIHRNNLDGQPQPPVRVRHARQAPT
jgi:hypothetical protein